MICCHGINEQWGRGAGRNSVKTNLYLRVVPLGSYYLTPLTTNVLKKLIFRVRVSYMATYTADKCLQKLRLFSVQFGAFGVNLSLEVGHVTDGLYKGSAGTLGSSGKHFQHIFVHLINNITKM